MASPTCCRTAAWLCLLLSLGPLRALTLVEADFCVYGGTSGGVVAAVQAARLGKTAVIMAPERHLGGMSASGLGVTDIGPHGRDYIGGISREFYRRVGAKYNKPEEVWFEPHVAEQVFQEMVAEASVRVFFSHPIASARKEDGRLTRIVSTEGLVVEARMFLDATYEGDLMALAGVGWTMGREANSQYGETLNGVRNPSFIGGRAIDPYLIPGNRQSGLLPLIQPGAPAPAGTADDRLQAYNYRLCLTNVPANRVPIQPPPDYSPARYEALARYIQSGPAPNKPPTRAQDWILDDIIDVQTLIPNGKTDINAAAPISTDFVGGNVGYVTASHEERRRIALEHEHYIRGMLHFLKTDPRVPANVRAEMESWGLARDEFTDNGHWPWQLYVREARRMVSDHVMTEKHGNGTLRAPESIGLAAYWLDSHYVQRFAVSDRIANEGGFFTSNPRWPPAPYPVAFRSIVPRERECTNLAVTFALSATHAAFASLRMEPVFMITSQSAAVAGCLALDAGVPIQQVPYPRLAAQLLASGQVLSQEAPPPHDDGSVIVDSEDPGRATVTGEWVPLTALPGFHGSHYLSDGNAGKGAKSVLFRPDLPADGSYSVHITWRHNPNSRATNVPLRLEHADGVTDLVLNQNVNAGDWFRLGTYRFLKGTTGSLLLSNAGTSNTVIADAVKWTPDPPIPPPPPAVQVFTKVRDAREAGPRPAVITLFRPVRSPQPLTVTVDIGGTAQAGADYPALPKTFTLPAHVQSLDVPVTALADDLPEGEETVTLSLRESAEYALSPGLAAAAVRLLDPPFDRWRAAAFPPSTDPAQTAPAADPDGDGIINALEAALGSSPLSPGGSPLRLEVAEGTVRAAFPQARGLETPLILEVSPDLREWSPVPGGLTSVESAGLTHQLVWEWPLPAAAAHFVRLRLP